MESPPVCIPDFEKIFWKFLDRRSWLYIQSGKQNEDTLKDNVDAYARYKIQPRVLRDVSNMDTTTTVLGQRISLPICIAPSALHGIVHPDGEVGTAKAAAAKACLYVMSSSASSTIEEIHGAAPASLKWFQVYMYRQRDLSVKLIKRAQRCGFTAVVLTVDSAAFSSSIPEKRQPFQLPKHVRHLKMEFGQFRQMTSSPNAETNMLRMNGRARFYLLSVYRSTFLFQLPVYDYKFENGMKALESEATFDVNHLDSDPELNWSDIAWLKKEINVPLVLKSILSAEDAALAVEAGVDGIIVSNHGGRQLDSVPATIDVLPEVVEAVAGRCEVYVDGGVRSGIDVVKALALGARAVFIGCPVLWGLGYDGEKGVDSVLSILHEELKTAMALTGARTVDSIVPSMVRHVSSFGKLTHKL